MTQQGKRSMCTPSILAMKRRPPRRIPGSPRFSATVSEEAIELDREAQGMHQLVLDVPNLVKIAKLVDRCQI